MLKLQNVKFGFRDKQLFSQLNISISENKITGIVGNNGVGKTSLFRIIAGIYKPQEGNIIYKNKKLVGLEVALLPTDPFFYSYMSGLEYLQLSTRCVPKDLLDTHVSEMNLPLEELVDGYSTGMKKKLAFSSIYLLNKPIVILDEPFNGVDLESNEILKYIIKQKAINRTTLISSHILSSLLDICDEIIHIQENFTMDLYSQENFDILMNKMKQRIDDKFSIPIGSNDNSTLG